MCCHALYVYTVCGHSHFAPTPIVLCRHASIAPDSSHSTQCELMAHPYKSWKLDTLCPGCTRRRDSNLQRLEHAQAQMVEYDEYKWKVSYALPASGDGKDFWTVRMEKLAQEEEQKEKEERMSQKKGKKRVSFKLRRRSKKSDEG